MREPRLGDDIDDFCVRCKRVTNHNIVSVVQGVAAKVRCRSCHSDHDFRHENAPPPKVDLRKQTLFNEVLKKVNPGGDGAAAVQAFEQQRGAAVIDDGDGDGPLVLLRFGFAGGHHLVAVGGGQGWFLTHDVSS